MQKVQEKLNPAICLRTLVSQKKNRMKKDGFNLDMTYITNYVIALGYPAASRFEQVIRNRREDVIEFFKKKHGVNVKIYNLCIEPDRQYDQSVIPEFAYAKYSFKDHNICSTKTIFKICVDIFLFLQRMTQQKIDIKNCLAKKENENKFTPDQLKKIDELFL